MEVSAVIKHIGKRVIITLRNNYTFTIIIPEQKDWDGEKTFSATDKRGDLVTIDCDFISLISPSYSSNQSNMEGNR